jgi:hypothetical protein
MECCFLITIGLLLVVIVPLVKMLFGKGPSNIRKLLQPDIAAFMVLTAGIALAFAIARLETSPTTAACLLAIVLPMAIAIAWFGRYAIEEFSELFGKRRKARLRDADLTFLDRQEEPDDIVPAELIDTPLDEPRGSPPEPERTPD